ncbi:unnamed protein product [Soboliphyme baturini]|uniref:DPPIV_N domain-containing protein n=1 Tax=Soboliphyme baturini TaxID=241478 RepID=A0A183J4D7_9BILA|nr:unnamed protein product [Soboliphyme baturini]
MKTHPESKSSDYIILMNSKPYLLYFASQRNPFQSDWFYWLDAGYGHGVARFPNENEQWSPSNVMVKSLTQKITIIKLVPHNLADFPISSIYRKNVALISGEFLGGSAQIIPRFYSLYSNVFQGLVQGGYVDDDQTTLVICYQKNPTMFNVVTGDWHSVFDMFH